MFLSAKVEGVDGRGIENGNVDVRRNEIADRHITLLPREPSAVDGFERNVRYRG